MEKERILKAYNDYIQTDIHKNCEKYRKLSDGKSADVFFADVRARVNLEYMGIVDNKGYMKSYYIDNFKSLRTNSIGYSLKDLVVGNGLLQATTRLYAEYATSKKLVTNQKDFELIKDFDLDDLLGKTMVIQSWAGKLLLKGVTQLDRFSFYPVTPKDYFPIRNEYNPKLIDGYVIYNLSQDDKSKKTLICEIYELDSIEYRAYKIIDKNIQELPYPYDLKINGMIPDGLGYRDNQAQGWAVVEVENIFGKSDYDDLVGNVRELVIGDTLTSQAFQKVANPLLQVPDSVIEIDKNGRSTVRLDGRVIIVNKDDKEVKQVQLETKTQEWKLHKEDIKNDIYKQLGVNDLAFGIDLGGSISSGEAKRRSLERTVATVESKRSKCITGIKNIILWGYKKLKGEEIDLQIEAQDILSLSLTEKMAIVVQGIQNNVMSLETAIKFLGILGKDTDEEIALIKANVGYQEKLINIMNILAGITREEELQVKLEELSKDIMKDLGLEVKEE